MLYSGGSWRPGVPSLILPDFGHFILIANPKTVLKQAFGKIVRLIFIRKYKIFWQTKIFLTKT